MRIYDEKHRTKIAEFLRNMARAVDDSALRHPIDFGIACRHLVDLLEEAEDCPTSYGEEETINEKFRNGFDEFYFEDSDPLVEYLLVPQYLSAEGIKT